MVGLFIVGVLYAMFLKFNRPARYSRLQVLSDEDAAEMNFIDKGQEQ